MYYHYVLGDACDDAAVQAVAVEDQKVVDFARFWIERGGQESA